MSARAAAVERHTAETGIRLALHLDGAGEADIHTGIGFFDHMLTLMPPNFRSVSKPSFRPVRILWV